MSVNKIYLSRLLIGLVTAWNLQAAWIFIFLPRSYVLAYELNGVTGEAAVRGVGVLFLMWNVPYVVALWNPIRFRLALVLAFVMQFIGLMGESFILSTLAMDHAILRASILRFIVFDGAGLILLVIAFLLVRKENTNE